MDRLVRHIGLCAAVVAALTAARLAEAQTGQAAPTASEAILLNASAEAAWAEVRSAQTPQQQAFAVRRFMAALATANGWPVAPPMDARDIASGRAVSPDDPTLLQRPQAHEVTLSVGGRFLTFRPLSRASLEPLSRR